MRQRIRKKKELDKKNNLKAKKNGYFNYFTEYETALSLHQKLSIYNTFLINSKSFCVCTV